MQIYQLRWNVHWTLFQRVQLTILKHWFTKWLDADQATVHYLNQCWVICWRIHASLGLNKLNLTSLWFSYLLGGAFNNQNSRLPIWQLLSSLVLNIHRSWRTVVSLYVGCTGTPVEYVIDWRFVLTGRNNATGSHFFVVEIKIRCKMLALILCTWWRCNFISEVFPSTKGGHSFQLPSYDVS